MQVWEKNWIREKAKGGGGAGEFEIDLECEIISLMKDR